MVTILWVVVWSGLAISFSRVVRLDEDGLDLLSGKAAMESGEWRQSQTARQLSLCRPDSPRSQGERGGSYESVSQAATSSQSVCQSTLTFLTLSL